MSSSSSIIVDTGRTQGHEWRVRTHQFTPSEGDVGLGVEMIAENHTVQIVVYGPHAAAFLETLGQACRVRAKSPDADPQMVQFSPWDDRGDEDKIEHDESPA